jgi:hypothetical protein
MGLQQFLLGIIAALVVVFRLEYVAYYICIGIALNIAGDDEEYGLTSATSFYMALVWPVSLTVTLYCLVAAVFQAIMIFLGYYEVEELMDETLEEPPDKEGSEK